MRLAFFAFLFAAGLGFAQTDSGRGSTPPGLSQDGARPAEGAIKGGSIAPGESAGVPSQAPSDPSARSGGATTGGSASRLQRCYQLEGTLREQCLAEEDDHRGLSRKSAPPRAPSGEATTPPATRRD